MLGRADQGFVDISAMALNAAISGSILAEPEACFVPEWRSALAPIGVGARRLAFHGTNGAPATAVVYGMHTPSVEQSDLPKTGAFDRIMFRHS